MEDKQVTFSKSIIIAASPTKVWAALTQPELIKKWMSETEIEILTDWEVGGPVIIQGPWYKSHFRNTGVVIEFEPGQSLVYTHLSSLSRLPDVPENYTRIDFKLDPLEVQTVLTLTLSNFATETIYKHLAFYWNVTLELLKKFIEQQ